MWSLLKYNTELSTQICNGVPTEVDGKCKSKYELVIKLLSATLAQWEERSTESEKGPDFKPRPIKIYKLYSIECPYKINFSVILTSLQRNITLCFTNTL